MRRVVAIGLAALVSLSACTRHARPHASTRSPYDGDLPEAAPTTIGADAATLTVTFVGKDLPTSVSLTCGEYKLRVPVVAGVAYLAGAPADPDCTLRPASAMGYTPARNVASAGSLVCDVTDYITSCR